MLKLNKTESDTLRQHNDSVIFTQIYNKHFNETERNYFNAYFIQL